VVPVFGDPTTAWVQDVAEDGSIHFHPCDTAGSHLLPVTPREADTEGPPLYAFAFSDSQVLVGTRGELEGPLRKRLGEVADYPFVKIEVCTFLEDEALRVAAIREAGSILRELDAEVGERWLKSNLPPGADLGDHPLTTGPAPERSPSATEPARKAVDIVLRAGSDAQGGVNFHDDFDEELVAEALAKLHLALPPGIGCCCVRMQVEQGKGCFRPFGKALLPDGSLVADPSANIALHELVPNGLDWPLLRLHVNGVSIFQQALGGASKVDVNWDAQIRNQQHNDFVGYLVFAGLGSTAVPPLGILLRAYYEAKKHVSYLVAQRNVRKTVASQDFQERLRATVAAIAKVDRTTALRHVADMLTSHLGARWNRAACFCPVDASTLRCLYAQGGDLSEGWSAGVQRPLAREAREVADLIQKATAEVLPQDDAYLRAAAGPHPLEVAEILAPANQNILAKLWRAAGNVALLEPHQQEREAWSVPLVNGHSFDRMTIDPRRREAAVFDHAEPWVHQVRVERPDSPIFVSRNERYWVLPWLSGPELIALWVVDVGYWTVERSQHPDPPSLTLSHYILRTVAPEFDIHRANYWDSGTPHESDMEKAKTTT
jgi:hypothetical protein